MKLTAAFLLVFFISTQAFAGRYDKVFDYDKKGFIADFEQLTEAEEFVKGEISRADFNLEAAPAFVKQIANDTDPDEEYRDPLLNMKPFAFSMLVTCVGGIFVSPCVAGPGAWLLVYLDSDKDREASRSAMWGCVTGNAIYWIPVAALYAFLIVGYGLY